ncbi:MAG: DNA-binding response regulator [Bacteroidetes bacterium]|nr:MAG: DNA-binding response regulator [Bacteroidota bacterium]
MTVGIIDDHELHLEGLQLLLTQAGITIVFVAKTGTEALQKLTVHTPDVLLCDVHLPDVIPEDLLLSIRELHPTTPIIYLTLMRGTRYLNKLLRGNIQGYLLKNASVHELLLALETVYKGGVYFSKTLEADSETEDYRRTVIVGGNAVNEILTKREQEILKLICTEHTNGDIAAKLYLSVGTVDTHRKNIIQKLGVKNTAGLVRYALRQGIID